MRFSALNYSRGITHALWAWGKYCILSNFYLLTAFAQTAKERGRPLPYEAAWKLTKTRLLLLCIVFFLNHLSGWSCYWYRRQTIPLFSRDSLYLDGLITGGAAPPALPVLARHLTEYQNIIAASEWANQHLIGGRRWWMTHCYNPSNWGRLTYEPPHCLCAVKDKRKTFKWT